ncbi:MAG: replication initiation protein [Clostridium sp.]|nr:replication initiation protein [Clostridium sp.]
MTEELLAQSNAITEGRRDWSRLEMNSVYTIIRQVRKTYVDVPEDEKKHAVYSNMIISMDESVLAEIADEKHRKDAKSALINLRHRDITMEDKEGKWFNCGFINWAQYSPQSKQFEVEVSALIMPHLVNLASQFTSYSLTVAIALKSKWAQRFYELCCQYRNHLENGTPVFHKSVEQIRKMFAIEDKYRDLHDLKTKIIDRAHDDLKSAYNNGKCDLWFDFAQRGKGENAEFDFRIHTKEATKAQIEQERARADMAYGIYKDLLTILKRDPNFCKKCWAHLDMHPSKVVPIREKLDRIKSKYKGGDLSKVVRFMLDEDFNMNKNTL